MISGRQYNSLSCFFRCQKRRRAVKTKIVPARLCRQGLLGDLFLCLFIRQLALSGELAKDGAKQILEGFLLCGTGDLGAAAKK